MNPKDALILVIFSIFLGVVMFGQSSSDSYKGEKNLLSAGIEKDTTTSVRGKTALFIGDSHTANHSFGWQKQLCDSTGMIMRNVSVGGKTTDWMLNEAVYGINDNIDFLFLYGGANDMYTGAMSPNDCLVNLQKIVNIAHSRRIKTIVITGFDPLKVVTANKNDYKSRYAHLQSLMLQKLQNCTVIDCRDIIKREDCSDPLCHMKKTGHQKITNQIIKDLRLLTIPITH